MIVPRGLYMYLIISLSEIPPINNLYTYFYHSMQSVTETELEMRNVQMNGIILVPRALWMIWVSHL